MPERSNGADSRSVGLCLRGFESSFPHFLFGRIRTSVLTCSLFANQNCLLILFTSNSPSLINFLYSNFLVILGSRNSAWIECFPPKEEVASSNLAESVNLIKGYFLELLDGHSILVTPDPVPNSEVKLDVFVFVLSLMGRREAVCLFF